MANQLTWSPAARDDLREIIRFISADNPSRAEVFALRLISRVELLKQQPMQGRVVPERRDPRYGKLFSGHTGLFIAWILTASQSSAFGIQPAGIWPLTFRGECAGFGCSSPAPAYYPASSLHWAAASSDLSQRLSLPEKAKRPYFCLTTSVTPCFACFVFFASRRKEDQGLSLFNQTSASLACGYEGPCAAAF